MKTPINHPALYHRHFEVLWPDVRECEKGGQKGGALSESGFGQSNVSVAFRFRLSSATAIFTAAYACLLYYYLVVPMDWGIL
jgi:hypothetical protein